ncbi:GAF domain-containing protein [Actinoplanes sp. LDG1-06]|uniref:Sensor-like histidine kinase SenX3 n=1 Tax=Paractinoplanes ovalisporus TaxID=2810368 RepID=A0ABS2A8L7_9ACTN|nr:ATP-binding protein [Actinoplanes ovalisporus]MBM2616185.1 GAF domain-containing protein [Actinoplanes ovalisporus]
MTEWLPERVAAAEREVGTTFDLTACVREPIHRLGGIQSYGALIALDDGRVAVASENAPDVLGVDVTAGELFLTAAQRDTLASLADADTGQTAMMPLELGERRFDVTVHRCDALVVLEFEPAPDTPGFGTLYAPVRQALTRLQRAGTVVEACQAAVREIQEITGYDRVVAYRFESADGPGEVIAEQVTDGWEPWLGLWFPATDVPPQARRLYERNWIRVIADVADTTARLVPGVLPATGAPLDLSLSVLRTVSPFHLEYLRNIEVTSSMSVSLLDAGRLWGLIACHGRAAKTLSPQTRAACEFFGVALSLHLAALRERDEAAAREKSREVIARLLERYSTDLPMRWSRDPAGLDQVIACDAVVVRTGDTVVAHGIDPADAPAALAAVTVPPPGEVWHSDAVDGPWPGALVLPFGTGGDCIVWLRAERSVPRRWAADPRTPVMLGPHGQRLTPRGSTAVFLASVRGRSTGWSTTDLAMAVELGRAIMGVAVAQARQLALLNVDLDSFAHAAAHDLKEPLRGIANTSTFIIEDAAAGMDPVTVRRLESIQRLATRMDELLNALLRYARLGRTELVRSPVPLPDAVDRALEVAGPRLTEAGVTLDVTSGSVHADPVLLDQVLVNLLVNAAKYARPEGGRIEVGLTDGALFVRDNGIGMPAHLREQAFQLFRRLHPDAARDGSGAGLAIVRRIAERHGGQAWAGESPGGGTTVWVTFASRDLQ